MNREQEKALGLLRQFISICECFNLKYYLVCGSALGAVKYKGFIPWDDDIDVAMFRDDYEKFCSEAPELLPDNYFLQNYHSDPAFPAIYSKLRDSNTTCIETSVASLPINHGISIDIFPLDGYPDSKKQRRQLELRKKIYTRLLSVVCARTQSWKEFIVKPIRLLGIGKNTAKIADMYTAYISQWKIDDCMYVANHGNWQGRLDYHKKEVFGEGKIAYFEDLLVIIPSAYDNYLHQKYGDYMSELPKEQQKSHHLYIRIDVDHPYTDYIKQKNK